jgi:HSP20 family protein
MNITPWRNRELDVFRDFEDLQHEMDRIFDISWFRKGNGRRDVLAAPALDVHQDKDNVYVKAEIPGMSKEDIDVSVQDNLLTIKGEKKQEKEIKDKDCLRTERYYGAISRSVQLPAGVDASKVKAEYKNGILELVLPKREDAKPKQIKVEVK